MSQTAYQIADKLDSAGLISPAEKKEFLKNRKEQEEHLKRLSNKGVYSLEEEMIDEPYYPLRVLQEIKIASTPGILSAMMFRPMEVEIPKEKENITIDKLTRYADKLYKSGFVSEKTRKALTPPIQKLELRSEYELIAFAEKRTEIEFFLTLPKYQKFADGLLERNLVSKDGYNEMIRRIKGGNFNNYEEPLQYIQNLTIIDLQKYPVKPESYLEAIYRETSKTFPGLEFDSISYNRELNKKESFDDFKTYNLVVTLKKGKQSYKYSSFINAESKGKIISPKKYEIPSEFYEVFNKMLADQLSEYRLHQVTVSEGKIGILALTKKQFDGLVWYYTGMSHGSYIGLSYENFTNRVTQKKIDDAIKVYDSLGLLSHLNTKEKDSSIAAIKNNQINYFNDILSSVKDIVFEIDLEYGVEDGQYAGLTKQLAALSKGNFNPIDIIDTYNFEKRKVFNYGFTLNGKKYSIELNQDDDWLDVRFWELIEKAIAEQDKKGKFYYLYPNDGMRLIYLTHEQAANLRRLQMIELEEPGD